MEHTYKVIEFKAKYKNQFEDKIQKLNNKAIKLDLPKYSISYKEPFEKENEVYLKVAIFGLVNLKVNDFEYVCSLQHLDQDQVLILGSGVVPEQYKKSKSECEHCKVERYRKKTYLLKKQETYIQVGSTCIKDFFEGHAPNHLEKMYDLIDDLNSFTYNIEKLEAKDVYPINKFLALSSAMIRDYGWNPSKSNYPTYQRVIDNYKNIQDITLTHYDFDQVEKALKWISNFTEKDLSNNYLHNIKTIVDYGIVELKTAPFAASIIEAFSKTNKQEKKESEYFGNVGDKVSLNLRFKKNFEFFSQYGTAFVYLFEDEDNNVFSWKTNKGFNLEENNIYLVSGTIKAHKFYKEKTKQTELTRCKVNNIYKE